MVLNACSLYMLDLMVKPIDGLTFTLASMCLYTAALGFGMSDIGPAARKKMLDLMQYAIFVMDAEGMIDDINEKGLALIDGERKEVLHKRPDMLIARSPVRERMFNDPGRSRSWSSSTGMTGPSMPS